MNKIEEHIYYIKLFDLYGNLLNKREKEIFNLFYEEDLSLQEIANIREVSKSSIGSAITTINKKLENYESNLGFYKKVSELKKLINDIDNKEIKERFKKIL